MKVNVLTLVTEILYLYIFKSLGNNQPKKRNKKKKQKKISSLA